MDKWSRPHKLSDVITYSCANFYGGLAHNRPSIYWLASNPTFKIFELNADISTKIEKKFAFREVESFPLVITETIKFTLNVVIAYGMRDVWE